jgi:hypothetical protein
MRYTIATIALLAAMFFAATASAQHSCNDGTYSSSTGRGTCSHHGGESDNDNGG